MTTLRELVGDDPTLTSVLAVFRKEYEKSPNQQIIHEKNAICRELICQQVKRNGWFEVVPVWGKRTCRACSGLGEVYKFEREPVKSRCTCEDGFVWIPCTHCDKGVYTAKNGSKHPCRYCMKREITRPGYVRRRCNKCLGKNYVKRLPKIKPNIKETTPCKICDGKGWVEPRINPLADLLKTTIDNKTE